MAAMSGRYANFGSFQNIGSLVANVAERASRAAIARLLHRASNGDTHAFREADVIRQRLGFEWADLIEERKAA